MNDGCDDDDDDVEAAGFVAAACDDDADDDVDGASIVEAEAVAVVESIFGGAMHRVP